MRPGPGPDFQAVWWKIIFLQVFWFILRRSHMLLSDDFVSKDICFHLLLTQDYNKRRKLSILFKRIIQDINASNHLIALTFVHS